MTASLHEPAKCAIDAFRASLATPAASMCAPRNAIDAGRSVDDTD